MAAQQSYIPSEVPNPDILNPSASENLVNWSGGELQYDSEHVDGSRTNRHNWHGWTERKYVGTASYGGAVRNALLSGSYGELRKLRVDANVDADSINVNSLVARNAEITEELQVENFSSATASFDNLQVPGTATVSNLKVVNGAEFSGSTAFQSSPIFRNDVHIQGNLFVEGSASYVNTDQLYIEDKSITVASGSTTKGQADGAGFDIAGANVTFHYNAANDRMELSTEFQAPEVTTDHFTAEQATVNSLTASVVEAATFTGSFVGDASGLTGLTMSISDAPKCKHVINIAAGETESVTHPFKTQNVFVQVYRWNNYPGEYPNEDEIADWEISATSVQDAQITVYPNPDTESQDRYKVDISYPSELHGYVVIADAGLYVSGSGFIDIVEATRETFWFGNDGGLDIVPVGAVQEGNEIIEKGDSYKFYHSLGTKDIIVSVYKYYPRVDTGSQQVVGWSPVQIFPEFIAINDTNEIEIKFAAAGEQGEDPILPQYFGYVVIAKAGSVVKQYNYNLSAEDLENFEIHCGTTGSWSAKRYNIGQAYIETASVEEIVTNRLKVSEYIDATIIGNLDTGQQYYGDSGSEKLWGSYTEYTDKGIYSVVRFSGTSSSDSYSESHSSGPLMLTASWLDKNGDLYLRGNLHINEVFSTSDIREKQNIQTLTDAAEKVKKLRGVSFEWKDSGEKSIGTIAQEVQSIYPELTKVYTNLEGKERISVNYEGLVGVLIEAVKALSERVEQLEKNENR